MAMTYQPFDPTKKPTTTEFAQALMKERARMHYTRRELADHCGVGQPVIERWERGESIPSVQQFKRLFGLRGMRRLAKTPPVWGWAGEAFMDGRFEEQRLDVVNTVKEMDERDPESRPPPLGFGEGLRRTREENEITLEQLGEILMVTGPAVGQWERENWCPVQENYDKLMEIFPELEAAISVGAVRKPEPQDIGKPVGREGMKFPRATTVDTMLQMTLEQSDRERNTPPPPPEPRWKDIDVSPAWQDPEEPEAPEPVEDKPLPVSELAKLAEMYANARLRAIKARRAENQAQIALTNASTDRRNADDEEREALALLDVAITEAAGPSGEE